MADISAGRRRRLYGAAAATAVGTFVAACGTTTTSTAAGNGARPTMKIAAVFLPSSLDPAKGIDAVFSFAETLTQTNDQGQAVPLLLAKAPEQQSPTTWLLTLRSGVSFQDGHAMTADTVAAAMNREMKLSSQAQSDLPGAVFTASGTDQVTVTTPTQENLLPYALADPAFAVYDEPVVAAAGNASAALANKGVFTAPYAITSFTEKGMTLVSYDRYWQGKPKLSGVQVTYVANAQTRLAAVESGQADLADGANNPDIVEALKGRSDVKLNLSDEPLLTLKLYFNPTTGPFTDTSVRHAIALALNYSSLATQYTAGTGSPADSLLPSSLPQHVASQNSDTNQAAALLDAAGWKAGTDGKRSKDGKQLALNLLIYNERPVFKPLSIGIKTELAKIGVTVNIVSQPFSYTMYDNASSWNLALYNDYSISPTGVPDSYLSTYLGTGGSGNHWHISDPALDALLSSLAHATSEADRKTHLAEIQHYVFDHGYVADVRDGYVVNKAWSSFTADAGFQQQEWTWQTAPSS
jgi:peptide/nickel transport system substrate-binding protein